MQARFERQLQLADPLSSVQVIRVPLPVTIATHRIVSQTDCICSYSLLSAFTGQTSASGLRARSVPVGVRHLVAVCDT